MVRCKICNKKFNAITNTHLSTHGFTIDEYINKYPNTVLTSTQTKKRQSKSGKGKNLGRLRPDVSKRQKENNVMWEKKSRRKASLTRRKLMEEGKINPKTMMKQIGRCDGPTGPEKRMIKNIDKLKIPLKFVGDGKFFVGRKCPDFINENMKIAVDLHRGTRTNIEVRKQYKR